MGSVVCGWFQHTAARRRLGILNGTVKANRGFQHTAARRRLVKTPRRGRRRRLVSTHSRPKAAGIASGLVVKLDNGFNTQPPEGGWGAVNELTVCQTKFQHTAARRRLVQRRFAAIKNSTVSTHSRPKAAGTSGILLIAGWLFQHTAARRRLAPHLPAFG